MLSINMLIDSIVNSHDVLFYLPCNSWHSSAARSWNEFRSFNPDCSLRRREQSGLKHLFAFAPSTAALNLRITASLSCLIKPVQPCFNSSAVFSPQGIHYRDRQPPTVHGQHETTSLSGLFSRKLRP